MLPDTVPSPILSFPSRREGLGSIEGILLAGSYPWSGSVFENLTPRPLLPVAQTPLIEHVLGWLHASGVERATICANGATASLRRHLQDGERLGVSLRYQQDMTPRGAAGCVRDAAAGTSASTLVVADGTSIPLVDLESLIERHRRTRAALTIVAHEREMGAGESSYLQPVGVYVFERDILDLVPVTSFQDIKETLVPKLYREGYRVDVYPVSEISPRVMNADSYLAANLWMVSRMAREAAAAGQFAEASGAGLMAPATAWIGPDALIVGPVLLGDGVRVHAGATIIGPACIGSGSIVESDAVLTRTLTWRNCVVGRRAVVDQSFLTSGVHIAPDTMVRNTLRAKAANVESGPFAPVARHAQAQPPASSALAKPALS